MKLNVFDSYVIKNLIVVTSFVALTLTAIILLTQSLRFLELIINSGASSGAFWMLAFLSVPRFFEVILPIALMVSALFVYNRMTADSENIVMRAAGNSPFQMARPALLLGLIVTIILLVITMWLAPVSLASMVKLRQVVKAQYSLLLFQEGVFNEIGKTLTVYIDKKTEKGELEGLLIYDHRPENPAPVTIIAKKGVIVATDKGQQVLVYDGSRQDFNKRTGALNRLDFKRYSIDLPDVDAVADYWKEPDERTFLELFNPDPNNLDDVKYQKEFTAEVNKRITSSFLPLTFISVVMCFMLLGSVRRRGQAYKILTAVIAVIILQSLFLSSTSLATKSIIGNILLYVVVFMPMGIALISLSSAGEALRQEILYHSKKSRIDMGAR